MSDAGPTPSLSLAEDMDNCILLVRITPAARHPGGGESRLGIDRTAAGGVGGCAGGSRGAEGVSASLTASTKTSLEWEVVDHNTRNVIKYYPSTPKSPSIDSTTSLAQLRDKLNAFTPREYNRVPQKICASPVLSTVRETSSEASDDHLANITVLHEVFYVMSDFEEIVHKEIVDCPKNSMIDKVCSDILVDKPKSTNKNEVTLYTLSSLSSESEDQDFKEKSFKVQKRVSSSNLESSAKKRSRMVKPKQFSDNELYSSEDESNMINNHKIVKQTKPRNRKVIKVQNLLLRKGKTKRLAESNVKIKKSSDNIIARVRDWLRRNVSASTSGKVPVDSATVKDNLAKVTETLETALTEMHQSFREKFVDYYLENQKRSEAFKEDSNKLMRFVDYYLEKLKRFEAFKEDSNKVMRKLDEMDKMSREGANQVLREDAEKKAQTVRLLIQAVVDFINRTDE